MGRVFSVEEIKTGLVPESADFQVSLEKFFEVVNEELKYGTIDGAVVYGSVAIGTPSRRSDFDCMIIPSNFLPRNLAAIPRIVAKTNESGKIQVNPIEHSRSRLASGDHDIDRFFKAHLTGEGRLVYGNDPADYIRSADRSPMIILEDYLRRKKRRILSAVHTEGSEKYKSLSRVLELPLAIGRKALRAHDELYGTNTSEFNTAEKSKLAQQAIKLFSSIGLDEVPQSIITLDSRYSSTLDQVYAGDIGELEYTKTIKEIEAMVSSASQWLDDFEVAFRDQIV